MQETGDVLFSHACASDMRHVSVVLAACSGCEQLWYPRVNLSLNARFVRKQCGPPIARSVMFHTTRICRSICFASVSLQNVSKATALPWNTLLCKLNIFLQLRIFRLNVTWMKCTTILTSESGVS